MKRFLVTLTCATAALILAGCTSGGGDDYDPNKIAVKQPGNGPPPMNSPMNEKTGTQQSGGGTTTG
jgi:hypothetical protein